MRCIRSEVRGGPDSRVMDSMHAAQSTYLAASYLLVHFIPCIYIRVSLNEGGTTTGYMHCTYMYRAFPATDGASLSRQKKFTAMLGLQSTGCGDDQAYMAIEDAPASSFLSYAEIRAAPRSRACVRTSWALLSLGCTLFAGLLLRPGARPALPASATDASALYASSHPHPHSTAAATHRSTCQPEVWIIRHGDKRPKSIAGNYTGLSAVGFARAAYLVHLVAAGVWPRFAAAFASNPRVPNYGLREEETVLPLSSWLGLQVNDSFPLDEEVSLGASAMGAAQGSCGTVLIAWEHCRIPRLMASLGCDDERCQRCWADSSFDQVVRLDVSGCELDKGGRVRAGCAARIPEPAEGFRPDPYAVDFDVYDCANPASDSKCYHGGKWFCDCQFPNGTWLDGPTFLKYKA